MNIAEFISSRNSRELLKLISLAQLLPENHGKNLRLERIQANIILGMNDVSTPLNIDGVQSFINDNYAYDMMEDPAECSFTENIMYEAGNCVVFPGVVTNSTETIQLWLQAIFHIKNSIPEDVKKEIWNACHLMLQLHDEIAKKLELKRYVFIESSSNEIELPSEEYFAAHGHIFEFDKGLMDRIQSDLGVPINTIDQFVFDIEEEEIDLRDLDTNPLLFKPFIFLKELEKYFLTLPTCETYALNDRIIKVLEQHGCLEEAVNTYDKLVRSEASKFLNGMGWEKLFNTEKYGIFDDLMVSESIWTFDENKYAYINVIPNEVLGEKQVSEDSEEDDFLNDELTERSVEVVKLLREHLSDREVEIFDFQIHAHYSTRGMGFMAWAENEYADQQIAMNCFDLQRFITYWDVDRLSLWKYSRAKKRAQDKEIMIAPIFSILTLYKWYLRNGCSFFDTDDQFNGISFDFDMQGEVKRTTNKKNDRHVILTRTEKGQFSYVAVYKTESHAPIYTSEEIFIGNYRKAFDYFNIPIWVEAGSNSFIESLFVDAILHWLNEMRDMISDHVNVIEGGQLTLKINVDEKLMEITTEDFLRLKEEESFVHTYTFDDYNKININIPVEIYPSMHRPDNYGEIMLMKTVLTTICKLVEFQDNEGTAESIIDHILAVSMPLGAAKMIVSGNTDNDIALLDKHIPKVRYIEKADNAIILEELVGWLNYANTIPENIPDKQGKIQLFVDTVDALILQLRQRIEGYDAEELLIYLMNWHESLIRETAYRKIHIPPRIQCFSRYKDVLEEYSATELKLVTTSLSIRGLIEFVVAEPPSGKKEINTNDVDFLLALMGEIVSKGYSQDLIRFDLANPKIGLLKSGRIGFSREFFDKTLAQYSEANREDELFKYQENFADEYRVKNHSQSEEFEPDTYMDTIDAVFNEELGITIPEIYGCSHVLTMHCYQNESSCSILNELEIEDILSRSICEMSKEKMQAYLSVFVLESRGKFDMKPDTLPFHEVFPWRYNRVLSYLNNPIIKLKTKEEDKYFFSARFLMKAFENLYANFLDGSLKTKVDTPKIKSLLSERNKMKGSDFTNAVRDWLYENTDFQIIPHEVKISVKGFLKADRNYGDVDVMVIDHSKKTIYAIECKSTKQAKTIYEFQMDLNNYTTKQVPKHEERNNWLIKNRKQIEEKFDLKNTYKVRSIIISSHQLPIKFMQKTKLKIYSFSEVKSKQIF